MHSCAQGPLSAQGLEQRCCLLASFPLEERWKDIWTGTGLRFPPAKLPGVRGAHAFMHCTNIN